MGVKKENQDSYNKKVWMILIIMIVLLLLLDISPTGTFKACNELISKLREDIEASDKTVEGFNIGTNNGEVAGQTIFHCHMHVIPRRDDDVINATGGVRNIIPGKGDYIKADS